MRHFAIFGLLICCGSLAGCGDGEASRSNDGTAPESRLCPRRELPAGFEESGRWDESFAVAGLAGLDGVSPIVRDVAAAPDGSALVVGYFRWAGQERIEEGLVRVRGQAFERVAEATKLPPAPEGWSAVTVAPDGAIVLAQFRADPSRVGAIVRLTPSGVETIGSIQGNVRSLGYVDDALIATGTFALEGGVRGFATWRGGVWSGAPGGDPDGPVYAATRLSTGELAVGGAFTNIGGIPAKNVAVLQGSSWTARSVEALRILRLVDSPTGLIAAGLTAGDGTSGSVERWTGTGWEVVGGGLSVGGVQRTPGPVADVVVEGETITAFGCFDRAGDADASGVARFDGTAWSAVPLGPVASHWFSSAACGFESNPEVAFFTAFQRATKIGADVLVGFEGGGLDRPSQSVTRLTPSGFEPVGASGGGLAGSIVELDATGEDCAPIALAGATHVGSTPITTPLLRWSDAGWAPAFPPLSSVDLPPGTSCGKLAATRAEAFLACVVTPSEPDFKERSLILRSSGEAWTIAGEVDVSIFSIEAGPDGSVWAAGGSQLVRVREGALEVVESGFEGITLAIGFGPLRSDGGFEVVVGGGFERIAGAPAARIARFDGTRFVAMGAGFTNSVTAIAVASDAVYAATSAEGIDGRIVLGRWDGRSWTEVATAENGLPAPLGETTHTFTRLAVHGDALLAVGYVWPETGGRNAFVYRGGRFAAIGGGIAAISVDAVAATSSGLLFGGSIAEVGQGVGRRSSVGAARFVY
jgi:hypothetical protein